MNPANRIFWAMIVLATAFLGFGWWGMMTESGQHQFDEMAGMIPLASLAAGALILVSAGFLWLWRLRRT